VLVQQEQKVDEERVATPLELSHRLAGGGLEGACDDEVT
jgi:hypothetical protein